MTQQPAHEPFQGRDTRCGYIRAEYAVGVSEWVSELMDGDKAAAYYRVEVWSAAVQTLSRSGPRAQLAFSDAVPRVQQSEHGKARRMVEVIGAATSFSGALA